MSLYYAFDLAGMNVILAYFTHALTVESKNLVPREMIRRFKVSRNALLITALIFLSSGLPLWWTTYLLGYPVRVVIWFLAVPITWVSRLFGTRT